MLIVNLVLFFFVIVLADNTYRDYSTIENIFTIKLPFLNENI